MEGDRSRAEALASLGAGFRATAYPRPFRRVQQAALDLLAARWSAGRRRVWVVLPPGAGKTLLGLEAARRLGRPVVVLSPNTAIQYQWIRAWQEFEPACVTAGDDRRLVCGVTSLTYQSLASFDPDAEVSEEGDAASAATPGGMLQRLHPNGRALVEAFRGLGEVTLVLDEAHHLLEVWGRLVAELLDLLPRAHVLGLTATPPATLTADQAQLVDTLFGAPEVIASVPAVVRDGHLAPFAELAWLVTPTAAETAWLSAEAERFAELRSDLLSPDFATTPFLTWLDLRLVQEASRAGLPWWRLERDKPALARAALRLSAAGLLPTPRDARIREEHRHESTAEDWVALLEDYVSGCLRPSDDPRDVVAITRIGAALPAVGYSLTRRGIRRGRSPVDRVLARSEAKTHGAIEIVAAEAADLGPRLRALVLCDHEQATATLPGRLVGVLDAEAGSARLMLANLIADERTAPLGAILMTGRTVAAAADTARAFAEWAETAAPGLHLEPVQADSGGIWEVTGRWSTRTWVRLVTDYFESGHCRVLVGTRALLGEGWDARTVTTLADLTTATTPTSVVQTRGRALRLDPDWPDKVANTWTVVCATERHPRGGADWDRFVRKHAGFLAAGPGGEILDGVGHVDPSFSPYYPPPERSFDSINVAMLERAADRNATRALWQVGEPYRDVTLPVLRVRPGRTARWREVAAAEAGPAAALPAARGVTLSPGVTRIGRPSPVLLALAGGLGLVAAVTVSATAFAAVLLAYAALHGATAAFRAGRVLREAGAAPPDLASFGCAVADALHADGRSAAGASAVRVALGSDGSYRATLEGVSADTAREFARALDEVLTAPAAPRYVIARYVADAHPRPTPFLAGAAWLLGLSPRNAVIYHAVPASFGVNAGKARVFAEAWSRWVSPAEPLYTASPTGAGALAVAEGCDPLDVGTALRLAWS